MGDSAAKIGTVHTAAYRIPTDQPEADGTFAWDATTLVVVHIEGGGARGLGYTGRLLNVDPVQPLFERAPPGRLSGMRRIVDQHFAVRRDGG